MTERVLPCLYAVDVEEILVYPESIETSVRAVAGHVKAVSAPHAQVEALLDSALPRAIGVVDNTEQLYVFAPFNLSLIGTRHG